MAGKFSRLLGLAALIGLARLCCVAVNSPEVCFRLVRVAAVGADLSRAQCTCTRLPRVHVPYRVGRDCLVPQKAGSAALSQKVGDSRSGRTFGGFSTMR